LGIAFVVGLAAHVGGYLLRSSVTTGLYGLVADLLYALGLALWTGVVVVLFVQVVPEVKRRQIKRTLDAYEATLREKAQAGSDRASGDDKAPTAR
jgi:membrane protein implicated in regulation of membrane protease activity